MANRIKGITVEIGGDVTDLDKALKTVNGTIKDTQSQLKDVERLLKLDPSNTELLNQKQRLLAEAVGQTKSKLDALKDAQEQAKKQLESGDLGQDKYDALQREIIETENKLKDLEDQAKKSNAALNKISEVGKKVKEVGGNITKVGEGMSKYVTAPIVAIGGASMAAFTEVDGAMDTVITKTGATGEALNQMQTAVTNLATTIPTDFQTAGDAVGEVATRFDDVGDNLEDLSGKFIKFATLNNTDVTTAVDNVQASMAAFGVPTKDAGAVLDTLNAIAQNTGTDVNQLTTLMTQNAGVMKEMGYSYEDAASFMGELNKNGVDVSSTMTGLKKAWQTASEEGKDMSSVLGDMNDTIKNAKTDQEAYQKAIDLFGAKAGPAIAQAVRDGRLSLEDLNISMETYAGNVEETFDATQDPIDQTTLLMNNLKLIGSDLASVAQEMLIPIFEKLREKVQQLREWWSGLSDEQQQFIIKAALVVAAIGPVLAIIGKVITVVGTLMTLAPVLGAAIGAIAAPLGIFIAAAAATVAIGITLYKNWDTIKEKGKELVDTIKKKWEEFKTATSEKFSQIKEDISQKWSAIKQNVSEKVTQIKTDVTQKWDNIKSSTSEKINSMKQTISEKFTSIKTDVVQKFEAIKTGITDKIEAAKEKVRSAIEKIKSFFNFEWELPHIKLPHFSITGNFSLNPPSVPHLSVDWYKKAMNNGMILNGPTIFGMKGNSLLAGGEAGSETVVGTNSLMSMIDKAVSSAGKSVEITNNVYVEGYGSDLNELAQKVGEVIGSTTVQKLRMSGSW